MNYWRDFWWSMQVAFYMQCIDSTTFMNWREQGIAGVPNIAGC
jgi:hypothetical protein